MIDKIRYEGPVDERILVGALADINLSNGQRRWYKIIVVTKNSMEMVPLAWYKNIWMNMRRWLK